MKLLLPLALLLSFSALAQEGLYDAAPPVDSAFVRVLNAPTATLGTKAVTAEKGAASAYVVIPQGQVAAKLGATAGKLNLEAGKFYSVIQAGGKLVLLTDQAADNRAKALLTIYNLSKVANIDLKTADGKTTVIAGVKPGESGNRAVNGITVELAAFNGTKVLGRLKSVALERGSAYAIVVTDTGVIMTTSTTNTK